MKFIRRHIDLKWESPIEKDGIDFGIWEKRTMGILSLLMGGMSIMLLWVATFVSFEPSHVVVDAIIRTLLVIMACLTLQLTAVFILMWRGLHFKNLEWDNWWRFFAGTRVRYLPKDTLFVGLNLDMNMWLAEHSRNWMWYKDGDYLVFLSKQQATMFKLSCPI
jgi:hypothetical protein